MVQGCDGRTSTDSRLSKAGGSLDAKRKTGTSRKDAYVYVSGVTYAANVRCPQRTCPRQEETFRASVCT